MVMQRPAKPSTPVRFRPPPPVPWDEYPVEDWVIVSSHLLGPGGEIGRHKGLKIPRQKWRTGSIPVPGTTPSFLFWDAKWYNFAALKVYRWAVAHFLFVLRD